MIDIVKFLNSIFISLTVLFCFIYLIYFFRKKKKDEKK